MNNKLYNLSFFNVRNLLLVVGTLAFLALAVFLLLMQRNDYLNINDYKIYI